MRAALHVIACLSGATAVAGEPLVAYDDQLENGFAAIAVNAAVDIDAGDACFSGTRCIHVDAGPYGGVWITAWGTDAGVDFFPFGGVDFWVDLTSATPTRPQVFEVVFTRGMTQLGPALNFIGTAGWFRFPLPWWGGIDAGPVDGIRLRNNMAVPRAFRVDQVRGLDAGHEDVGAADAGTEDAGTEDAGTEDAGIEDAGIEDGGAAADSGTRADAGPPHPGSTTGCGCNQLGGMAFDVLLAAGALARRCAGRRSRETREWPLT